jgi:hypothetical protein
MIDLLIAGLIAIEPTPATPPNIYRQETFIGRTRDHRHCATVARQEYVKRNLQSPWGQPIYRYYADTKSCFLVTYRKRSSVLDGL